MNKTLTWVIVIVIVIVGGYYLFFNKKEEVLGEPIKIGGVYILSGPVAAYGEIQMHASQMAIDEINASGGINGRPLELVVEDSAYDPKQAVSAYENLKLKGIKFFMADGSPILGAIHPKIVEDGNFNIAQGSVLPSYRDGKKYTCRIAITAEVFGPAMADFLTDQLKARKVSFLVSNNDYGRSMESETSRVFIKNGGQVLASEYFGTSDGDFRTQITKLKAKQDETDALFIINPANTIEPLLKQLGELGWKKPIISDLWTVRNPQLKEIALAEGIYLADYEYNPDDGGADSAKAREFKEKYRSKFPEKPAYLAAAVYDSIKILAEAFRARGTDSIEAVSDYITKIKNFEGVTGTLSFTDDCEVTRNVVFRRVSEGKIVDLR